MVGLVSDNTTAEGRRRTQRVEIVLSEDELATTALR
jgi:hypothetical protein